MRADAATCRECTTLLRQGNDTGLCEVHLATGQLYVPKEVFSEPVVRAALAGRELGPLFIAIRQELRLSQTELARYLGLTQGQISAAEHGARRIVDVDIVLNVLVALGVPPELVGFPSRTPGSVEAERREENMMWPWRSETTPVADASVGSKVTGRRTVLHGGVAAAAIAATHQLIGAAAPARAAGRAGDGAIPEWASVIAAAVRHPGAAMRALLAAHNDVPLSLAELDTQVGIASRQSLLSQFHQLGALLPGLLGYGEATAASTAGRRDPQRALALLSDIYALLGWALIKGRLPDAARLAAEGAVQAAAEADDRVRMAAAMRCLAEVEMSADHCELAMQTALTATAHLTTVPAEQTGLATSIRCAAYQSAAVAAARGGNARDAAACLRAAADYAEQMGADSSELVTVAGPTNVAIHRVVIPLELGDPRTANQHVPRMMLRNLPAELGERHGRALIDVARVNTALEDRAGALGALLEAERRAPDEVRHHRHTLTVIRQLWPHERAGTGLRELVSRCGIAPDELGVCP